MTTQVQLAMSDVAFQNTHAIFHGLAPGQLLYFKDSAENCVDVSLDNRYLSWLQRYGNQDFTAVQLNQFTNHLISYVTEHYRGTARNNGEHSENERRKKLLNQFKEIIQGMEQLKTTYYEKSSNKEMIVLSSINSLKQCQEGLQISNEEGQQIGTQQIQQIAREEIRRELRKVRIRESSLPVLPRSEQKNTSQPIPIPTAATAPVWRLSLSDHSSTEKSIDALLYAKIKQLREMYERAINANRCSEKVGEAYRKWETNSKALLEKHIIDRTLNSETVGESQTKARENNFYELLFEATTIEKQLQEALNPPGNP